MTSAYAAGAETTGHVLENFFLAMIEAILRETLRWAPVFPLGVFHATSSDDEIDGYFIPKGAAVLSNVWAMTRDESVYPDPESFLPERFLTEEGTCNDDQMLVAFGFGRRICAGRHFAVQALWMAMASILSQFHIEQPKDGAGRLIKSLADANHSDGLISHGWRVRFHTQLKVDSESDRFSYIEIRTNTKISEGLSSLTMTYRSSRHPSQPNIIMAKNGRLAMLAIRPSHPSFDESLGRGSVVYIYPSLKYLYPESTPIALDLNFKPGGQKDRRNAVHGSSYGQTFVYKTLQESAPYNQQSPTSMIPLIWVLVALTLVLVFILDARRRKRNQVFYPPGPKPRFLTENLFDVPASKPWKRYHDWGKVYGDMIHLKVLGQHTIVLNSRELAERMLEKRSRVYSDRPSVPMLDVTGWTKLNTGILFHICKAYRDGPDRSSLLYRAQDWRMHRRLYQQGFRENVIQNYQPVITSKVGQLLSSLRQSPDLFEAHIKTYTAAVTLGTMYGYDITSSNDRLVHIAEEAIEAASYAISPAMMVVNVFPFLRHFPVKYPIFEFQRVIRNTRERLNEMRTVPYEFVKKNMETGKGKPALLAKLLADHKTNGGAEYQEELIIDAVTTAYAAGVETILVVLLNFYLAMALHPEIQEKARIEIETVVGKERLPTYEDRSDLPYIEAILRETLRWSPPFPSVSSMQRAFVTSNIWAMTRDESIYPDPELFVPERFLTDAGTLNGDKMLLPFGFGRRTCAGRHFAISTLWTAMASILSQFHISQPEDMTGQPITKLADLNYSDGFISVRAEDSLLITPQQSCKKKGMFCLYIAWRLPSTITWHAIVASLSSEKKFVVNSRDGGPTVECDDGSCNRTGTSIFTMKQQYLDQGDSDTEVTPFAKTSWVE
ncbi:cytochrome P450 [Marasmius fiardii PR-910]|nr:cytochrome P450 [Marasmius fiardii PR-910]